MEVYEAIKKRRTIRRFEQTPVPANALETLVDSARLAPFGANLQPLKYGIVTDEDKRKLLFPHIKYAGYLPDWDPSFEECPTAFIVIMNDTSIKPTDKTECDSGAAVMSMCLAAENLGLGTCWLGAIDRAEIKKALNIDDKYDITYLLGVGYPAQTGKVYDMTDSVKYDFDENGNVRVPKRPMSEVLIKL